MNEKWRTVLDKLGWAALIAFGGFLAIGAVLVLVYHNQQLVDPPFLKSFLVVGPLALIATVVQFVYIKDWGARAGMLALMTILCLFTQFVAVFGWLNWINSDLDRSRPTEHHVEVRGQSHHKGQKVLLVEPWHMDREFQNVNVSDDLAAQKPKRIIVTTRAGAWGFEWISNVKVVR